MKAMLNEGEGTGHFINPQADVNKNIPLFQERLLNKEFCLF